MRNSRLQLIKKQQALREWFAKINWRSMVGLTLNLKQAFSTPEGALIRIDEIAAKTAFKRFKNGIDHHFYHNAVRRFGRKLKLFLF